MAAFSRIMNSTYEKYKGCLIRIDGDKYIWADVPHASLEAAKEAIDAAGPELKKTINRVKK